MTRLDELNGKQVIVRCVQSGMFYGTVLDRRGTEILLKNSRWLWYWKGAISACALATEGTTDPASCKFTAVVNQRVLLDAKDIIICTEQGSDNIESVPVWVQ